MCSNHMLKENIRDKKSKRMYVLVTIEISNLSKFYLKWKIFRILLIRYFGNFRSVDIRKV